MIKCKGVRRHLALPGGRPNQPAAIFLSFEAKEHSNAPLGVYQHPVVADIDRLALERGGFNRERDRELDVTTCANPAFYFVHSGLQSSTLSYSVSSA